MDEAIKWGTLIGAVVAALTGLQSFIWQFLDRKDRIVVSYGSARPTFNPGQGLFVVNISKHPIELIDYGFILENGKLFSLIEYMAYEGVQDDVKIEVSGSAVLEPRELYDFYVLDLTNLKTVGAYARTTTQKHLSIGMSGSFNIFQANWYKARVCLYRLFRN